MTFCQPPAPQTRYEAIGLLPKAARTAANYPCTAERRAHAALHQAPHAGFSIEDIEKLLGLWKNKSRSSAAVKRLAATHIDELKTRLAELQSMVDSLEHLARHCHGDDRPECPILEDLEKGS